MDDLSRDREFLHAHRILMRTGLSLVSAFAWVFVFQYSLGLSGAIGSAFLAALLLYALSQAVTAVATPLSASHLRAGMKRSLVFGACLAALSFAVLGATLAGYFSQPLGWGLVLFCVFLGAERALYWIPYRLQAAHAGDTRHPFFEILIALMPAFAGLTLVTVLLSPLRLLFGSAVLIMLSIIPALFVEDLGERFEWGYLDTFRKVFDERHRALTSRAMLSGIESAALFLIWPLSVFLIVGSSYMLFGLIMSASLLVLLATRNLYKNFVNSRLPQGSMALDVAFSMSGWILRLASGTPVAVVFADSYSYISAPAGAPDFLSREHASDAGSYLDEYTALQEIATAFGRICMCAFTASFIILLPLSLALAASLMVAAFAAGFSAALAYTSKVRAY